MKKILLCLLLALSTAMLQAQDLIRPISAGIKAGGNLTGIMNSGAAMDDQIFGMHAGLLGNYRITKQHAVQIELLYASKGFYQPDKNVKNTLTYLELPVLYKRSFFCYRKGGNVSERSRKGNFYLTAGPQLSALLTSTATFQKTEVAPELSDRTIDLYAYTRPFDISAVAGAGYCFKNGLSLEMRYAFGFRHLHGSPHALMPRNASNVALQAGISYLMPLNY